MYETSWRPGSWSLSRDYLFLSALIVNYLLAALAITLIIRMIRNILHYGFSGSKNDTKLSTWFPSLNLNHVFDEETQNHPHNFQIYYSEQIFGLGSWQVTSSDRWHHASIWHNINPGILGEADTNVGVYTLSLLFWIILFSPIANPLLHSERRHLYT